MSLSAPPARAVGVSGHRRVWPLLVLALAGCARGKSPASAGPLFTLLPSSYTGVTFSNTLAETVVRNAFSYEYYYNGGGVAVGDLNGDGLPDLYFTGNVVSNRLYLNRGGMHFEDVTRQAGVEGLKGGWATGVTLADVNGDGRLDIYVSQSGPFKDPDQRRNILYINLGNRNGIPIFRNEAAAYGLDDPGYSTQAAFFDCDGDGDLDMYLMNAGIPGYRTLQALKSGHSPYEVDKLYRNDGGHFVDISAQAGLIDSNIGFGLGLSVGDLNNDGRPDIYVANDYSGRDYLYLGQGGCRFHEVLKESMGHTPLASMGSDIGDLDGDGWMDLAVLEMAMRDNHERKVSENGAEDDRLTELQRQGLHFQYQMNALQWNRGIGPDGVPHFSDIASVAGVGRTDWSWAPLFADFDNDGRPDLFISNGVAWNSLNADFDDYANRRVAEVQAKEGHITPELVRELLAKLPRHKVSNRVFRNDGDLKFTDETQAWGLDHPSYSNGAVYADLDRDGDLDLVVNNLMGEAYVYRNDGARGDSAHYLEVSFRGAKGNPFGIGARIRLKAEGRWQTQELYLTRGYQSSVEPVLHFGLGAAARVDSLLVTWPDGERETLTDVAADRLLTLDHADAGPPPPAPPPPAPLFRDARADLVPLPHNYSTLPPVDTTYLPYPSRRDEVALAVGDLNGDGLDDFVFGGSGGRPSRVYLQGRDGRFRAGASLPGATGPAVAAAIFDVDGDGRSDILLVTRDGGRLRYRIFLNAGSGRFRAAGTVPGPPRAAGVTLAPADYDGDGRVDLFIGSRTVPGEGFGSGSRLLRNEPGGFRDVTEEAAPLLPELSTVTDAVWADVDGDGTRDLVVVGEWMPVTVLLDHAGRFEDATRSAGLEGRTGWWQSVTAADIDGDGDTDLVVGNVGLDYPYHPASETPFELYVGDFNGNGGSEAVPAYYENGKDYPWFGRDRLAEILPWVSDRFATRDAYGRATLSEVLGPGRLVAARKFEVSTVESGWLENTGGGRFVWHALPREAQVSPITGAVVADFDHDGTADLVVAGNLEGFDASVPRLDGGVGLFLKGDGRGGFRPVPPQQSGLWLTGPVRRLALVRVGSDGALALLGAVAGGDALFVR